MLYQEMKKPIYWVGGAIGAVLVYGFFWAMAIGCVAVGFGPEVCGL